MRNKLTVIKRRAAVLNQINNLTNKCGKNHYKESFNYLINVDVWLRLKCASPAHLLSLKSSSGNMVYCYAYGCTHRSDNNKSNCHLFRFPTDEKVRRKWIDLCRYVDLSLICKKYKATPINTRRKFELITNYICHVCNLNILILLLEQISIFCRLRLINPKFLQFRVFITFLIRNSSIETAERHE